MDSDSKKSEFTKKLNSDDIVNCNIKGTVFKGIKGDVCAIKITSRTDLYNRCNITTFPDIAHDRKRMHSNACGWSAFESILHTYTSSGVQSTLNTITDFKQRVTDILGGLPEDNKYGIKDHIAILADTAFHELFLHILTKWYIPNTDVYWLVFGNSDKLKMFRHVNRGSGDSVAFVYIDGHVVLARPVSIQLYTTGENDAVKKSKAQTKLIAAQLYIQDMKTQGEHLPDGFFDFRDKYNSCTYMPDISLAASVNSLIKRYEKSQSQMRTSPSRL